MAWRLGALLLVAGTCASSGLKTGQFPGSSKPPRRSNSMAWKKQAQADVQFLLIDHAQIGEVLNGATDRDIAYGTACKRAGTWNNRHQYLLTMAKCIRHAGPVGPQSCWNYEEAGIPALCSGCFSRFFYYADRKDCDMCVADVCNKPCLECMNGHTPAFEECTGMKNAFNYLCPAWFVKNQTVLDPNENW